MLKLLALSGGLAFIGFGIVAGQGFLIRFARNVDFKNGTVHMITSALQTPYLYLAVLIYGAAILCYLYISRLISFSALNLSVTGLVIIFTLCADLFVFKESLNWAHFIGAGFMLLGLVFMLLATKTSGAL